jgi:hypothetical protein
MKHCSEEDLVLHYYGEDGWRGRTRRHLDACPECGKAFAALASDLGEIEAPETPFRDDNYGLEVWHRIRHRLPDQEPGWGLARLAIAHPLAAAAAIVLLVAAAFLAGRSWPQPQASPASVATVAEPDPISADAAERVRLAALAEHFERTERVLLDVVTADSLSGDLSDQQMWVSGLLAANRLYRDASVTAGDEPVVAVLDELERALLEIAHGPATASPEELHDIRLRVDAATLLFKVRVLSQTLGDRESDTPELRTTT